MSREIERALDTIQVGVRHRKELGDLDALAESIQRLGLLQPITVTPDGVLVCGWRRLEAVKRLGLSTVKVWIRTGVSDGVTTLLAEQDENTLRKAYNQVEQAELYREVKALLAEDAARRQEATRFVPVSDGVPVTRGGNVASHTGPREDVGRAAAIGPGKLPEPFDQRTSRHRAAQLVTGKAAYKRLERIGALTDIADDPGAPEHVRQVAAEAVEQIRTGAPVFPTAERAAARIAALDPTRQQIVAVAAEEIAGAAAEAIARVTTGVAPAARAAPQAPAHRSLRSWVLLWRELDGWDAHYDPATVAPAVSDDEWARFERVAEAVLGFRDAGRAARTTTPPDTTPDPADGDAA